MEDSQDEDMRRTMKLNSEKYDFSAKRLEEYLSFRQRGDKILQKNFVEVIFPLRITLFMCLFHCLLNNYERNRTS
jgi:hypothetical protein